MQDMIIADGLYLVHKNITKTSTKINTQVQTDHIVLIDCSGSMYNELPQIRQQLKNKLPMMLKPEDTVSIIWFSSRNQYGVVVEAVAMRTAVDLSGVHRAIDNFLKPIGMTGFVDPLEEVGRLIGRIQKPGRAINLFFMSDGHDNQWRQNEIIAAVEKLKPIVSSAAVVEYGYYCNRPLMVKMSEQLGASEILAENFMQYEPIFETAMTKKITGAKKVEVHLSTKPLHGFAFAVGDGEILSFGVDEHNTVLVPEGIGEVYWLSEIPATTEVCITESLGFYQQPLYASLVPLTQRMLSNDIFRVLKALGDVRLIRQFGNCFGKQAYSEFQSAAAECVFDLKQRLVDGYNSDEVPAEDAYTVLDLLHLLASDEGNLFYPSHESFSYERIGRKAIETDRVLSETETQRVGDIAARLGQTRDPAEIARLQVELSAMVEDRHSLRFLADNPDAGYPVSSLVLNEDRPNVSAHVTIPGTIDLSEALVTDGNLDLSRVPDEFPTHIHRNYTIIRDGIRNVNVLPVSLTEQTHRILVDNGVLSSTAPWVADHIYEIDLTKLPLINRKMVKSVSAKELFEKQYELLRAKAAQKVFNHHFDQNFPSQASKGFADKYGSDVAVWLNGLGIKDYGYSPKVELAEVTESYYGKELSVAIAGLSSLPGVKAVLDKIAAGKKLSAREILLNHPIKEVNDFMTSAGYVSLTEAARNDLLKVWLTNRKRDTIAVSRRLMREIAQIKFSVVIGQVWFQEFASLDENTLVMKFDGADVPCSVNLNEIEIKV